MNKPVTDNQWREAARLARGVEGLFRSVFQTALTDGTVEKFLRNLVQSEVVYPDWVECHETSELASKRVVNPGVVKLWLDPCQESGGQYPTGHEVYDEIKKNNLLKNSLSLGHLQWYAQNPSKIPQDSKNKLIYAWADVVRSTGGKLYVPCLYCRTPQPYVHWHWLGHRWHGVEPAGLRKEV